MPSSKADYLSKYLDGPSSEKKSKKKKKKKDKKRHVLSSRDYQQEPKAVIYDDDDDNDRAMVKDPQEQDDEMDDPMLDEEDRPVVVPSEELGGVVSSNDAPASSHHPRGSWETEAVTNNAAEPRRRQRHDSDDESESPPAVTGRRRRHDDHDSSDEDAIRPAAARRRRHDSSDSSSEDDETHQSRRQRHDSSEESRDKKYPVGIKQEEDGTIAIKQETQEDAPAHPRQRHDSDSSPSPSRNQHSRRHDFSSSSEEDDGKGRAARMASGHKAGLQNYQDFNRAEDKIQQRKHSDAQHMVDKYGMGETVYRDAEGRQTAKPTASSKMKELSPQEQAALNTGRVQREKAEAQAREFERIQSSSFSRHEPDDRLEAQRKNEIREGDPMAAYAAKSSLDKKNLKSSKKKKSKKSSIDSEQVFVEKPVYKGPPPKPNRFGIRPGYRWDGVDRGNGFEDKLLEKQFSSNRKREDAYRWSSADM